MGVEVKQTLERDYDLVLSMGDIRQLSINKLREIASGEATTSEDSSANQSKERVESISDDVNDSGISVSRGSDSAMLVPTDDIVKMKEGIAGQRPLFIVHPIEGQSVRTLIFTDQVL